MGNNCTNTWGQFESPVITVAAAWCWAAGYTQNCGFYRNGNMWRIGRRSENKSISVSRNGHMKMFSSRMVENMEVGEGSIVGVVD